MTADGMRRRRVCTVCKRRFTTYEKLGAPSLKVHKRDGSVEPFDGDKLFHALRRVAAHRNTITDDDLRRVARDIEATLLDGGHKTIAWSEIVNHALARLQNIDPISARRLAANYTDEAGQLRFDREAAREPSPQLGLPLRDGDDAPD